MKYILSLLAIIAIGYGVFVMVLQRPAAPDTDITNSITVPSPVDQAKLELYIRTNITKLSKTKPVLGGSWYVTDISWDQPGTGGTVFYEDGHIAVRAAFTATQQPSGESIIVFTQETNL